MVMFLAVTRRSSHGPTLRQPTMSKCRGVDFPQSRDDGFARRFEQLRGLGGGGVRHDRLNPDRGQIPRLVHDIVRGHRFVHVYQRRHFDLVPVASHVVAVAAQYRQFSGVGVGVTENIAGVGGDEAKGPMLPTCATQDTGSRGIHGRG